MNANDLHVSDGRGTEAQNCKPITNLKENSELSNYCKTSAYRLNAVSVSLVTQWYNFKSRPLSSILSNCQMNQIN
jgi:hypothetical protein